MPARSAILLVALVLPGVAAAADRALLAVSAYVVTNIQLTMRGEPSAVVLTGEDVARGYVDLPAGPQLEVKTNSREKLLVMFSSTAPFSGVELLDQARGSLVVPGVERGVAVETYPLRYRLRIAPNTQPGVHAWPVRVVASPI